MPDMTKPWEHIKYEIEQMRRKAKAARIEIVKLNTIAETCEMQAETLEWALNEELKKKSAVTVTTLPI